MTPPGDEVSPTVVGRQAEGRFLDDEWALARAGARRTVLVEGVPGIGRTTVVTRFLARHPRAPRTVLGALPWEADAPGALLRRLLPEAQASGDAGAWGQSLAAVWRSSAEPSILVVDDAHAADPASVRALVSALAEPTPPVSESLAQSGPDAGRAGLLVVLLAATGPDAVAHPATRDALDRLAAPRLRLAPLGPEQTRLLAARVAGIDLPVPIARRLCRHAGGIPRHLVEILRDSPPVRWSDWQARLPAPTSVQQTVQAALDGCSPAARRLVEAAAVLGDTPRLADAAELGEVVGIGPEEGSGPDDQVIAALDEAFAAGLLASAEAHGLDVLIFRRRFVRGAVHAALPPARRHDLHRRAADLASDETERLRHLVEAAPLPDAGLATELVALAGRKADEGAWAVVAGALIDAGRISPDRAEREDRVIQAIDALAGAGLIGQAVDALPDVEGLPSGVRRDAVLAYVAVQRGRRAEAAGYLDSAWRSRGTDREAAAVVCQRQVLHALADWDGEALVRWAGRAIEHAPAGTPAAVETRAIVGLGHAARGDTAAAFTAYRHAVQEIPSGPQHQRSRMGLGWLLLAQDQPEEARRELEYAASNLRGTGSNRITAWALGWLARTRFALGDWSGALQTVDQAELLLDATDLDLLRPLVHWTGAQVHALRGELTDAERHLELGHAAEHDYLVMTVPALTARAQVAEAQSDYDAVTRHLAPLATRRERGGLDEPGFWPWHDLYANALVVTDRLGEADEFLGPLEETVRRRGHRSGAARLGYARARLLGARGDLDRAVESFVAARAQLEDLPLPYDRARIDFAHGLTLRRAGRRKEATAVLSTARQTFAALGAAISVERCDRELKTLQPGARVVDDLDSLTVQERTIADLVARGLTNKEVATEMLLSVKTVQSHLTRTYAKLGVRSRSELAANLPRETRTMAP